MADTYWEVRKVGNQHIAEAWRRGKDGGGATVEQPLHQAVVGDLIGVRGELRAKGATPSPLKPAKPDVIEVWW